MKNPSKVFACLLIVCAGLLTPLQAKTIRLLTIGNSFAEDSTAYLPAMAKSAGNEVILFRANPGGCSFERHAGAMQAFELNPADPKGRLYKPLWVPVRQGTPKMYSLQEALAAEKWDYVTIQQVSNLSFKYETFEPFAKSIVECVHKYAPGAEILIHQTWAYRQDYPGFADGTFNQQLMFDGLVSSYAKLGDAYHLRTIPVGTAMQEARKLPRWTFKYPDATFNYVEPVAGTKPDEAGSLNVGWKITRQTTKKAPNIDESFETPGATPGTPAPAIEQGVAPDAAGTGTAAAVAEKPSVKAEKLVATLDFKHCNPEGRFLGASVFYGFLFGGKVSDLTYVPAGVKPEDAATLRGVADKVLASTKK